MINKQGLWFLTLFSLILVLSIYYITMPNQTFKAKEKEEVKEVSKEESNLSYLETLKIELKEEREEIISSLEEVINSDTEKEEKNKAYEKLKDISNIEAQEENLVTKIKKTCNLDSFVKASSDEILVVAENKKHDVKLANTIMRTVQEEYKEPMHISVKFS